jgi:hypothetical protein
MGSREVCAGFLWGKMRERDHSEIIGVDGGKCRKVDLQKVKWDVEGIYLARDKEKLWFSGLW